MSLLLSDEALVEQSINGRQDAFGSLVKRHQGMIKGMLYNLSRDSHIAEELAQLTFLATREKLHQYQQGVFKSWLGTIAYRQFLMWKRARRTGHDDTTDELSAEPDFLTYRDLHNALGQLTAIQLEVIVLTFLIGLTQREASDLLDLPLGTVKSHAKRGTAQLSLLLDNANNE